MVNLISPELRARLTTRYITRLATIATLAVGTAFFITAVVMLPTYFLIHAEADQASEYVETAKAIADERAKGAAQETLATFHESVRLLTDSGREPSYGHILSLLTDGRPRGVTLSDISVVYDESGNASVSVGGVARTRAELIAYSQELKEVVEFSNVTVPVSDLVADVDSSFSLTLTWIRPKKP